MEPIVERTLQNCEEIKNTDSDHPMDSCFKEEEADKDQFFSLHSSNEIEDNQESSVEKSRSRRRKGLSKPRRIKPVESGSVLESDLRQIEDQPKDMIDMHESLALHRNTSPKSIIVSARSPVSVESPESLYMNEKPDDVLDNGLANGSGSFVKVRHMSSDDVKPAVLYDVSNSMQRTLSSEERRRKASLLSENRSQEVPELLQRSPSNQSSSSLSQISTGPFLHSSAYDTINGNPTNAIVAMAAGMGLPTMIPTSAILTSSVSPLIAMHQSQLNRESNGYPENKIVTADPIPTHRNLNFPGSGRGIIGSSGVMPRTPMSPTPEEKAQYKRPPHTYPALIASAILDSPGNLITLRSIYDYIMNNFPYYKYCHDKSAWQNSIRHNLSLNQCFVKVPRYENAAKSNYWTMTREGFEEFGNENSFKRRRRRGAALAPISAYKAKKGQNDGTKNNGRSKNDNKNRSTTGSASRPHSEDDYVMPLPSQLMGLAAAWGPGLRADEAQLKGRKRSLSPSGSEAAKQQKMMILQQGDGPTLGGSDEGKRPNSLSSVEEMQGALSSLSKNLLDPSAISKNLPQAFQSWNPKSLISSTGLILPTMMNADRVVKSPEKSASEDFKNRGSPVLMEGIEIGTEALLRSDASGVPVYHYRCGFCSYAYVSTSGIVLEQHTRMLHQLEVTNARAKAVAAAAVAKSQAEKLHEKNDATKRLALQNLMSGLSSASIMAAAQSNASNLLAAQTSVGNTSTGYPYNGTFSAGLLSDSIMRSMTEQTATSQSNASDRGLSNVEALAYQRKQALNVFQQAAAAAASSPSVASQEQLRSFYQQVMMQNPFLVNSAVFPRQVPESDESNQLKQQLWQYQQQVINQMKALSGERNSPNSQLAESRMSPRKSPTAYTDVDSELKRSIHGWKQCTRCSFTAKGDHGLELHYRKAHVDVITSQRSPQGSLYENDVINKELSTCEAQRSESPLVSSAFPTPPLSNSPAYTKRHFVPLDLSGVKEDEQSRTTASATTQTSSEGASAKRTCEHCDIVFGDEMMHALHMSCHDREDPFKCKVCSKRCNERYYFNVHLLRGLHQNGAVNASSPAFVPDSSSEPVDVAEPVPRCHSNGSDVAPATELKACQE